MQITPRPLTVLLAPFPDDARNVGPKTGIVLTDEYQNEPSQWSTVVAVGKGVGDLAPGDVVFTQRYPASAWQIVVDGTLFVSVKYDEILAKKRGVN